MAREDGHQVKKEESAGTKQITRRSFLKGVTVGAAAAGAAIAGFNAALPHPAVAVAGEGKYPVVNCDVVVGGAGMGGMQAALAAAEAGAKTVLVEASKKTGGTSLFSGGVIHFWGAMTFDELKQRVPLVDAELGRVMMEGWKEFIDFARRNGLSDQVGTVRIPGRPISIDNAIGMVPTPTGQRRFFDKCEALFRSWGGTLMLETRVIKLLVDTDGAAVGFRVKNSRGITDIQAKAVVLATGSFQANKELVSRYFGPNADLAAARSVPYNTGDALIMGLAMGAKFSRSMATFYGHLQPYPIIAPQTPEQYEKMDAGEIYEIMSSVQDYAPASVVVNLNGQRFIDESLGDDLINQAIVQQPQALAFVVLDSEIYEKQAKQWFDVIRRHGGTIVEGNTLENVAEKLSQQFGLRKDTFLATLQEFNQAVDDGRTAQLVVPKTKNVNKIDKPPFYAVPATAGISGPYGGLKINAKGQVIGIGEEPIPGLFAAPMAAGGVYYRYYGGAIALCASLGRIAGKNAAAAAKER